MGFFREHEPASAGQRIKTGLRESAKLEFAVAVGEKRKHIKGQPIRRGLVERGKNARIVGVTGSPGEQGFGVLAAIAAKISVEQIHHGPQVTPFFDVHLENVPQVVHRRARRAEHSLLLHGSGFGVSLSDDHPAQSRAIFTRHFLPSRLSFVHSEIHFAFFITRLQENAPAVFRHLYVAKLRPAVGFHADGGSQVHLIVVALVWSHVVPPSHVRGLPMFEGALPDAVSTQIDVVWNFLRVVNHRDLPRTPDSSPSIQTLSQLNFTGAPVPYTFSAPLVPTAFGRLKIQFCQAERRRKIRFSSVSVGTHRRFASSPVRASGDCAARDSMAWRISSSPSRYSVAAGTIPASSASRAERFFPIAPRNSSIFASSL